MSKTAVVTGGSRGIGFEIARLLIKGGYSVVFCARHKGEVEEAERNLGKNSKGFVCDISKSEDIQSFADKVSEEFEQIDVLVNNAGVAVWKNFEDQDEKDIEDQIRINLEGLIKITKIFLPSVTGTIVNISSGAGKKGYEELTTYCATKFGVRGFTQALALELNHLKVYSVNPGLTSTRMTNFEGIPAEKVAEVVINTLKGKYHTPSGGDVDVDEILSD